MNALFAKIGWVKSKDSNGFDVYIIPDGTILNKFPKSWDPSAMDHLVFMDEISVGEDVHFGMLNCILPFMPKMIENRSTFIIFPRNTSKFMIIKSILEVFPEKYTKEQLESKRFVSSTGRRMNR